MCRMLLCDSLLNLPYPCVQHFLVVTPACRCHVATAWGSLGVNPIRPINFPLIVAWHISHSWHLALTILALALALALKILAWFRDIISTNCLEVYVITLVCDEMQQNRPSQ